MSGREEVATYLHSLQDSITSLSRRIDDGIRQLPDVKTDDLGRYLSEYRRVLETWHREQLEEWDAFVASKGLQMSEHWQLPSETGSKQHNADEPGPPRHFGAQLQSLEKRLAAMGGIPALGSVALPRTTGGTTPGLRATASPAAVEMLRGRLGSEADASTPLRETPGNSQQPQHSHEGVFTPHTVTLRKIEGVSNQLGEGGRSSVGRTPPPAAVGGVAEPDSELAAALARRAQKAAACTEDGDGEL